MKLILNVIISLACSATLGVLPMALAEPEPSPTPTPHEEPSATPHEEPSPTPDQEPGDDNGGDNGDNGGDSGGEEGNYDGRGGKEHGSLIAPGLYDGPTVTGAAAVVEI